MRRFAFINQVLSYFDFQRVYFMSNFMYALECIKRIRDNGFRLYPFISPTLESTKLLNGKQTILIYGRPINTPLQQAAITTRPSS